MQKLIKGTGLTRKQKAFADYLINNPKESATEAATQTYKGNRKSAEVIASENLRKPPIQIYLNSHIDKAKSRVVSLIDSDKEEIALKASDSVLDRALGKPLTRGVHLNATVNLEQALNSLE
jgi:phage terminase small subunit